MGIATRRYDTLKVLVLSKAKLYNNIVSDGTFDTGYLKVKSVESYLEKKHVALHGNTT